KTHFVLRLADNAADNDAVWQQKVPPLDGMNRMGVLRPGGNGAVLARMSGPPTLPVLAARNYGAGRTMAFAGDTTWRWVRPPAGAQLHARFWKQLILWLAKQEEAEGNAWVKPDARRLVSGAKLGFAVGLRGRGGVEVKEPRFEAKVVGPDGAETSVQTV